MLQAALGERIDIDVLTGKYRFAVPRGTTHGEKLRIENMGISNPYPVGKKRGDHVLDITVDVPKDLDEDLLKLMQQYAKVESPSLKNYMPKEDDDDE